MDENGNTVAPAYTSDSLKEGTAYDVTAQAALSIQGYTYKTTAGDAVTGTLDGNKVVTVVYTKDAVIEDHYYTVTVNYVDEDGNVLAPAYTSASLLEGTAYDVTAQAALSIQGYTYKATAGDAVTGTLDGSKVVTVVYTKDAVDPTPVNPDPSKPEPTKPADTPQTGDSSRMFLWLGLAVVSGGAAMGAVIANKKKNHSR